MQVVRHRSSGLRGLKEGGTRHKAQADKEIMLIRLRLVLM